MCSRFGAQQLIISGAGNRDSGSGPRSAGLSSSSYGAMGGCADQKLGEAVLRCTLTKLVVTTRADNTAANRHQDGEFLGDWRVVIDLPLIPDDGHTAEGDSAAATSGYEADLMQSSSSSSRDGWSCKLGDRELKAEETARVSRCMHFYRIVDALNTGADAEAAVVTKANRKLTPCPVLSTPLVIVAMNERAAGAPEGLPRTRSPFVHERTGMGVSAVFDLKYLPPF